MKPLSARTTPRRLMAPISRHFLPVLQPEPPAWLTTGLMNGSRLPFALYLPFGATCCSLSPSPLPGAPLPATVAAVAPTVGFGGALRLTVTAGACAALAAAGVDWGVPS